MRFATEEVFQDFLNTHHVRVHGTQKVTADAKPTPKVKAAAERSKIEEQLSHQIKLAGLPPPIEWPTQFEPIPGRKYRTDFAWPAAKLIVEVDGAVHRIKGTFKSSFERGALLLLAGWRVLHVGGDEVRGGMAVEWVRQLLDRP